MNRLEDPRVLGQFMKQGYMGVNKVSMGWIMDLAKAVKKPKGHLVKDQCQDQRRRIGYGHKTNNTPASHLFDAAIWIERAVERNTQVSFRKQYRCKLVTTSRIDIFDSPNMMEPFDLSLYKSYRDLPLPELETLSYSVYVLDLDWCYLYANAFELRKLGEAGKGLIGRNMFATFPALRDDPSYQKIKETLEAGLETKTIVLSPVYQQRVQICGRPMLDCYFFCTAVIIEKENLLNELRSQLKSGHKRK